MIWDEGAWRGIHCDPLSQIGGVAHLHLITLACAGPYKTGGRRPSLKTDAQFMLRKEGRRWRGSMLDQWQIFPWDRPRHTKAISYICCPLRFNRERTVSIIIIIFLNIFGVGLSHCNGILRTVQGSSNIYFGLSFCFLDMNEIGVADTRNRWEDLLREEACSMIHSQNMIWKETYWA